MTLTTVIDVGNFSTKYSYQDKKEIKSNSFSSVLHRYKHLEEVKGMRRFQYNNKDYFVGEGVMQFYFGREKEAYFGNVMKGHHEAQIRLVAALYEIYKETGKNEFNLILTCPYDSMEHDKKYFVDNFSGEREALVDEEPFRFVVHNIKMAAEGLGAFYFSKFINCTIVDAGSKTLNILHLINGSISRDDSHSLNGGTLDNTFDELADTFAKKCSSINYDFPIICTGGRAEEMKEALNGLDYSNVIVAELKGQPSFYINAVGLLLKYGKAFEVMFAHE